MRACLIFAHTHTFGDTHFATGMHYAFCWTNSNLECFTYLTNMPLPLDMHTHIESNRSYIVTVFSANGLNERTRISVTRCYIRIGAEFAPQIVIRNQFNVRGASCVPFFLSAMCWDFDGCAEDADAAVDLFLFFYFMHARHHFSIIRMQISVHVLCEHIVFQRRSEAETETKTETVVAR